MNYVECLFRKLIGVFVIVVLSAIGRPCRAALPTETVEGIVEKATASKERIKNMSVEYGVSWEFHMETLEYKKDQLALNPYTVRMIYDNEKRFCEVTVEGKEARQRKTSFDGDYTVKYTIGSAIVTDGKQSECEDIFYISEFLSIPITDSDRVAADRGLFYPSGLLPPRRLPFPLPAGKKFDITGTEVIDGSECYVVEMAKSAKYWVDPKIGYMYRKRELYYPDGDDAYLQNRYLLGDYREVIPGVWLPFECKRETFPGSLNPRDRRNKKSLTLKVNVRNITLNKVTDDDFKLVLPAGTLVSSTAGSYVIPGDNTVTLDQFSELARKTSVESGSTRRWIDIILIMSVIAAVVVTIGHWVMNRRGARMSGAEAS